MHPGANVGVDLFLWIAFAITAVFAMFAAIVGSLTAVWVSLANLNFLEHPVHCESKLLVLISKWQQWALSAIRKESC